MWEEVVRGIENIKVNNKNSGYITVMQSNDKYF